MKIIDKKTIEHFPLKKNGIFISSLPDNFLSDDIKSFIMISLMSKDDDYFRVIFRNFIIYPSQDIWNKLYAYYKQYRQSKTIIDKKESSLYNNFVCLDILFNQKLKAEILFLNKK